MEDFQQQKAALQTRLSNLYKEFSVVSKEKQSSRAPEFVAAINANKAIKAQLDTLLREVNLKQILASLS